MSDKEGITAYRTPSITGTEVQVVLRQSAGSKEPTRDYPWHMWPFRVALLVVPLDFDPNDLERIVTTLKTLIAPTEEKPI